jgi:acetoin utilization deacetylase AcuC-like enzyme
MGFCLFNNVAVAAAHARVNGARKVAIIDYDVHHGNGTQHLFDTDPHVLYVSTHQYPFYPGTGAADEIGRDRGRGFTVNVPIEVGAVDDDYYQVFDEIVVPVVREFEPDLVMVSAGFDAHDSDPLGGMRLSTLAFGAMTGALRAVAEDCCLGRIVAIAEGGYDLVALAESLESTIEALGGSSSFVEWPTSSIASVRGRDAIQNVKTHLRGFWKL